MMLIIHICINAVMHRIIFIQVKCLHVFPVEITSPVTGDLTSLYDQIFNAPLTVAYQHGEGLTLVCFFKRNLVLCILTLGFLCFLVSDETEVQAIFC